MTARDLNDNSAVWHTDSQTIFAYFDAYIKAAEIVLFLLVTGIPSVNYDMYEDEDAIEELQGPRSWVGPALASAIFCFLPTGLIAFYNARKARKSFETGDMHSWTRYRGRARFLVFVTCVLGILVYIAIIAIVQGVKHTNTT